jgi:hypothetical protein
MQSIDRTRRSPESGKARLLSIQLFSALSLALLAICAGCAGRAEKGAADAGAKPGSGVFFVATTGDDHWSGTLAAPNATGTDGPFRSIAKAIETARRAGARGGAKVFVRGGTYFQKTPLVLKPEDSGLLLAAYPNEIPVISGGTRVTGWKQRTVDGRDLWVAPVPAEAAKQPFVELWANDERAVRARNPNHGYLKLATVDKMPKWQEGQSRFRFHDGDLLAGSGITNAEVVVMSRWVESRLPIASVDVASNTVTFSKRAVFELSAGDLYYVEGALEHVDEPGEWAFDPQGREIFYLPRPGETLDHFEAVIPALAQVLRIEGDPARGKFVERVTLRGLWFSHAEWYFPADFATAKNRPSISPEPAAEVGGFAQAAIGVPGAVWGRGLRACAFDHCAFRNLGDYGLELADGCQSNRIVQCEFADLGAGGIKLGETKVPPSDNELTARNEISGCSLRDGGKVFHSAIGIWIGQSPANRIARNVIRDFYYTGISIGWTWGYGPSAASNNVVEFNHVHHIGMKSDGDGPVLSDMGGIYTLGRQPGTIIRNNVWHDIAALRYGGWGIYFDEGSSGILAENNIVCRTTHGGFHQHYGQTNIVRNNIFAFGRDAQVQRTRAEPHNSFTFERNIVYFNSGTLLSGNWSGDNFVMDHNLYYDAREGATPASMRFAGATLEQWRARGHDAHSLIEDPGFVDPERHDLELQPGSPAASIGFQPINFN